jgi:hypothetical protein
VTTLARVARVRPLAERRRAVLGGGYDAGWSVHGSAAPSAPKR